MTETGLAAFVLARLTEDEEYGRNFACECAEHLVPNPGCRARVLADVEAKRTIAERYALVFSEFEDSVGIWPDVNRREKSHAWATLSDLALPYREHPDWRGEWR